MLRFFYSSYGTILWNNQRGTLHSWEGINDGLLDCENLLYPWIISIIYSSILREHFNIRSKLIQYQSSTFVIINSRCRIPKKESSNFERWKVCIVCLDGKECVKQLQKSHYSLSRFTAFHSRSENGIMRKKTC